MDKKTLLENLATTSDGSLKGGNDYDDFIIAIIDDRTDKDGVVDLEEVHNDFQYMSSELFKAMKVIERVQK